ncbi:MAG: hypothetical protein Hyperionvirus2_10 [Hyperionvirus sp.]|uniref:Uncharacterized protein n=1 Tax=Hyperionvirus sp. TaxID=2487770 RepID=A0A3G5A6I7_9VIRU|nr:MAG: hypothetical protein Hyperionvirus2_10 [Hyperionvirus sp.]
MRDTNPIDILAEIICKYNESKAKDCKNCRSHKCDPASIKRQLLERLEENLVRTHHIGFPGSQGPIGPPGRSGVGGSLIAFSAGLASGPSGVDPTYFEMDVVLTFGSYFQTDITSASPSPELTNMAFIPSKNGTISNLQASMDLTAILPPEPPFIPLVFTFSLYSSPSTNGPAQSPNPYQTKNFNTVLNFDNPGVYTDSNLNMGSVSVKAAERIILAVKLTSGNSAEINGGAPVGVTASYVFTPS